MFTRTQNKFVDSERHERAILHMVGQVCEMREHGVTVAEVAAFMSVSKPTAQKYLDRWTKENKLIKTKYKHGVHGKIKYVLSAIAEDMYYASDYHECYKLYVQKVLKEVI